MSDKLRAATHGAPTETRCRLHAPHSDDGDLLREAATVIEQLRAKVAQVWREGYEEGWLADENSMGNPTNPYGVAP